LAPATTAFADIDTVVPGALIISAGVAIAATPLTPPGRINCVTASGKRLSVKLSPVSEKRVVPEGAPSLAQRPDGFVAEHLANLRYFYEVTKGWPSAPHLFVDDHLQQDWTLGLITAVAIPIAEPIPHRTDKLKLDVSVRNNQWRLIGER